MSQRDSRLVDLRAKIVDLVGAYAELAYTPQPFEPGCTPIPVSGKVLGGPELKNLVEASLDGWLTTGRFNDAFEEKIAAFLGVRYALTTNSGSSANLLALSALAAANALVIVPPGVRSLPEGASVQGWFLEPPIGGRGAAPRP